jgi:hypothetical protein
LGKHWKLTLEQRKKLSDSHKGQIPWIKGHHLSDITKKKISDAKKGYHPKTEFKKGEPSLMRGKHHTEETRRKISDNNKGHIVLESTREKMSNSKKGHVASELTKKKMSDSHKGKDNHHKGRYKRYGEEREDWLKNTFRCTPEYKAWEQIVKERDHYVCQLCGAAVGLIAHHIKGWIKYPELRYDISNGITLCGGHGGLQAGTCHYFVHFLDRWSYKD